MDEDYDSTTPSRPNALDTVLAVAGLAAFIGSGLIGGAAALPLLIMGGVCLAGSVIASIIREPKEECWPCPEQDTSMISLESPTVLKDRGGTPEQGRWVERIQSTRAASAKRGQ